VQAQNVQAQKSAGLAKPGSFGMAIGVSRHYDDPNAFASALKPADVGITITQQGRFAAVATTVRLKGLWLQRSEDNLARIACVELMPECAEFTFLTGPSDEVFFGGAELERGVIVRQSAGRSYYQRSLGATSLGNVSVLADGIAELATMIGQDLTPPRLPASLLPSAQAMQRLLNLHTVAARLVVEAPEILARPAATRGLEQAVMVALDDCLNTARCVIDTAARRSHEIIMRRFSRTLQDHPGLSVFLPEICSKIGVSARTLRTCCQEHLGMGPKRFLILRSMNLARNALVAADADSTTVTQLATEFGFWELGRFASVYRDLFGEVPSTTLRRAGRPALDDIFSTGRRIDRARAQPPAAIPPPIKQTATFQA
jgi:AraC-like DNA-binding protein